MAYIQGLQAEGVAATVKHFAGNEFEYQRGTINSVIAERALRELYLLPFELAVKEGRTWAVMSAYNKLNGTYCSENRRLLTDHPARAVGLRWAGDERLGRHPLGRRERAGRARPGNAGTGEGPRDPAGRSRSGRRHARRPCARPARNVLRLIERTGTLDQPARRERRRRTRRGVRRYTRLDPPGGRGGDGFAEERGQLAAACRRGARVAVVGPNAATAQVMGGGSAQMNAHRRVSPLDGLREALGEENVTYARGLRQRQVPAHLAGPHAYRVPRPEGDAVLAEEDRAAGRGDVVRRADGRARRVPRAPDEHPRRIAEAGEYEFSLASAGLSRLCIDGAEVIDNWENYRPGGTYFGLGSDEVRARQALSAGEHAAVIEFTPQQAMPALPAERRAVRLAQAAAGQQHADAARLAAAADYAVVCIGTNGDWETEGVDRWGLTCPVGRMSSCARWRGRTRNTIVLLQTGGPVLMPWLDEVGARGASLVPRPGGRTTPLPMCCLAGRSRADGCRRPSPPASRTTRCIPSIPTGSIRGKPAEVEYREGLYHRLPPR